MTGKEMGFTVFLVHSLAESLGLLPAAVYAKLEQTGILDDYIVPCYDTLHTMGSQALVEDITGFLRERGAL